MDFQFELGNTLDKTLRGFEGKEFAPSFLINTRGTDYEVALEIFFALYNRGYIKNVDHKAYERADDIDVADKFRITVEGRDYIELHCIWYRRFWIRSLLCPVIVSFITALNAAPIWRAFKQIVQLLSTP